MHRLDIEPRHPFVYHNYTQFVFYKIGLNGFIIINYLTNQPALRIIFYPLRV
jgi:hypothetical protein